MIAPFEPLEPPCNGVQHVWKKEGGGDSSRDKQAPEEFVCEFVCKCGASKEVVREKGPGSRWMRTILFEPLNVVFAPELAWHDDPEAPF